MAAPASRNARTSVAPAWIGWIAAVSVTALTAVGCAADDDAATSSEDEIFGGIRDDDARAKSAVIALRIGREGEYDLCSGTLLAPNVVLTARHCVAKDAADTIICDEEGRSANDRDFSGDLDPSEIAVFLGPAPSFGKAPAAVAKTIVSPDGPWLCNADIALVVLDRAVEGVTPFAVRFGAQARLGEEIRAVGYGRNDAKVPMGTRFRRENVPVLAVGKGISPSKTRLGDSEFEVGKSICEGDSGGPAISELTGAVIGVVSRGGPCGDDFGHVYTATFGFQELFERAFTAAGAAPVVEANTPPPDPEAAPRASAGESSAPTRTEPKAGGCAVAAAPRAPSVSLAAVALFALAFAARRRQSQ